MKAGDLHIAVTAQMAAFDASMMEVEQKARQTGLNAGMSFQDQFEASSQKIAQNFLKQFASPMIVSQMANTVAEALRSGFSMKTVEDAIKGLPFAGGFGNLGMSLADSLFSVRGEVNEWYRSVGLGFLADANEAVYGVAISAEKQMAAANAAAESEKQIAEYAKSTQDTLEKIADIEDKRTRDKIARGGNERRTIMELARMDMERVANENKEYLELQQQRADVLDGSVRDAIVQELDAAKKLPDAKIAQIIEERDEKLKALDIQFVRETEQQMELQETRRKQSEEVEKREAERVSRLAEKTSKDFADKFEKQMDDIDEQISEVEQKRMGVAASTASAATALGTFTVSSYTDAEKKKIDADSLNELKRLRRAMENVGAGGGFR